MHKIGYCSKIFLLYFSLNLYDQKAAGKSELSHSN
jgi:hypothetical protein